MQKELYIKNIQFLKKIKKLIRDLIFIIYWREETVQKLIKKMPRYQMNAK